MPRFDVVQTNFTVGEITSRLRGRLDFERLFNGVEIMENFIVLPHGGATRRPGTCYVSDAIDPLNTSRMIDFVFSTVQAYAIEFGGKKIRWYRNLGQLFVEFNSSPITNGDFLTDFTGWTDESTGTGTATRDSTLKAMKLVAGTGIGIGQQSVTFVETLEHVIKFRVRGNRNDFVSLRIGITSGAADILAELDWKVGWHCVAFTPTGASPMFVQFRNALARDVFVDDVEIISKAPVEIDTEYGAGELFGIGKTQSADILYLGHEDHRNYELRRIGASTWSLIEHDFQDGPYLAINTTATTLNPSAATGTITVVASSVVGINDGLGFLSTDVGRLIRIKESGAWTWMYISAVASTTSITCFVRGADLGASIAVTDWRLGAWSDTTGWPRATVFHEERLIWAKGQTISMSNSGDFNNHAPTDPDETVTDSHAIVITLATNSVHDILWMASTTSGLMVGTDAGEFLVKNPSDTGAMTPTKIEATKHTNRGSEPDIPIAQIDQGILFVQKGGRTVREAEHSFDKGVTTSDLGILSEHMLREGLLDMAYQQQPYSVLWTVRKDGQLIGLTHEKEQKVFAWHRHPLGGEFSTLAHSIVESICVIPHEDMNQLWLSVKLTISGETKRQIYAMDKPYEKGADLNSVCMSDGAVFQDTGSAQKTFGGFEHLECETVDVIADGILISVQVFDGAITLNIAATQLTVGTQFTGTLITMPFDAGLQGQTTSGKVKNIHQAHILLDEALGGKVGPSLTELEDIGYRSKMGSLPDLFSGPKTVLIPSSYTKSAQVVVQTTGSLPFTINNIAFDMQVHGS